jgi:hypothetical protein
MDGIEFLSVFFFLIDFVQKQCACEVPSEFFAEDFGGVQFNPRKSPKVWIAMTVPGMGSGDTLQQGVPTAQGFPGVAPQIGKKLPIVEKSNGGGFSGC